MITTHSSFVTTDSYWDCECPDNYIKDRNQDECEICNSKKEDQPESRVNEVLDAGFGLTREDVNFLADKEILMWLL